MVWELIDEDEVNQGRYVLEPEDTSDDSFLRQAGVRARGALAGLGEYGALSEALGIQQKEDLPGQLARRGMEQDILSKMTQQEGYIPSLGELEMLSDGGDVLPDYSRFITPEEIKESVDVATGGKYIPRTEAERRAAERFESGVGFSMFNPLAAPAEFASGYLFKGGEQAAEEAGLGKVGQFVAGVGATGIPGLLKFGYKSLKSGKNLLKDVFSSKKIPETVPAFFKETGTKRALADIELSSKELINRTAKTSEEQLSKLKELTAKEGSPLLKDIEELSASKIEKDLIRENQGAFLDQIAPEAKTHKEAWKDVSNFVEKNFETAKEGYSVLYDAVESGSRDMGAIPRESFKIASEISDGLRDSLLRIPEEVPIRTTIEELIRELRPMAEGNLVELPMNRIMATKRSVNRLISRSKQALDVIPNANDLLFPIAKALNKDIISSLGQRPGLQNMYRNAERLFSEAQSVFNNDAVLKLRRSQSPEEMTAFFSKPSNLEKLKPALGENKDVGNFVDRLIVQNVMKKDTTTARGLLNEMKDSLGSNANRVSEELLEYGDKLTSRGQQSITRRNILEDLQRAYDTGARPEYIYKQMLTETGSKLVENSLGASPKGRAALKSLKRQLAEESLNSIITDGKIDYSKAADLLKNPQLEKAFLETVGKEGVDVLKKMSVYGKNLNENLALFAAKEPSMWRTLIEKELPKGTTSVLSLLSIAKPIVGIPALTAAIGRKGISAVNRARLLRLLKNPESLEAIKTLGSSRKLFSAGVVAKLLKKIGKEISSEDEDEE